LKWLFKPPAITSRQKEACNRERNAHCRFLPTQIAFLIFAETIRHLIVFSPVHRVCCAHRIGIVFQSGRDYFWGSRSGSRTFEESLPLSARPQSELYHMALTTYHEHREGPAGPFRTPEIMPHLFPEAPYQSFVGVDAATGTAAWQVPK